MTEPLKFKTPQFEQLDMENATTLQAKVKAHVFIGQLPDCLSILNAPKWAVNILIFAICLGAKV